MTNVQESNLSSQILEDLLSLYLAGEASQDTTALIESHLANNPKLAELAALSQSLELPAAELDNKEKEREVQSIEKTKKNLHLQSWALGLAIFMTAALFSFGSFDDRGLHWLVLGTKAFPFYAAGAAIFWGIWLMQRSQSAL